MNVCFFFHLCFTIWMCVLFQCALDTHYWTLFNHITTWGSVFFYYVFMLILYVPGLNYYYQGVAFAVFATPTFWFTLVLTTVILILPVLAYRFYIQDITPSLSDQLRKTQRNKKSPDTVAKRRLLTQLSSSMRGGYAFSHETGFGRIITNGLNVFGLSRDKGRN